MPSVRVGVVGAGRGQPAHHPLRVARALPLLEHGVDRPSASDGAGHLAIGSKRLRTCSLGGALRERQDDMGVVPLGAERDAWREARLLPTVGIRGQEEQEQRATSSLLAVMRAVPDFGHALLGHVQAPRGRITTYTELRFTDGEGAGHRPDGAIVVERGKTSWCALVEVKTSSAELRADQVSRYLDVARDQGFDGVLTISNQLTRDAKTSPVAIDRRKTRRVGLWHLSWWQILTDAAGR